MPTTTHTVTVCFTADELEEYIARQYPSLAGVNLVAAIASMGLTAVTNCIRPEMANKAYIKALSNGLAVYGLLSAVEAYFERDKDDLERALGVLGTPAYANYKCKIVSVWTEYQTGSEIILVGVTLIVSVR